MASTFTLPPRPPDEIVAKWDPATRAYVEAFEELLAQLIMRVNDHDKALREAKRQATPFRREKKKKKRKKPGRKGGHKQSKRAEPKHADEEHHAEIPATCPHCGGHHLEEDHTYVQTYDDLKIVINVRQLVIHVGKCTDCGSAVEGRHPFQTSRARGAAAHQIGPTALALAAVLHYQQGVPFEKLVEIFKQFGFPIAKATLVRAMHRIAIRAEKPFEELLQKVLQQEVLHIDETGWSLDGQPHYLWVITGKDTTVYFVRKTRSGDEVADFLEDFKGVLVTDGHRGYDKLGRKLMRALCHLHLKRNLKSLEQKTKHRGKALARDLIWWVDEVIALVAMRQEYDDDEFKQVAAGLERQYFEILDTTPTNASNARMVKRLLDWQDAVLRCLRVEGVPATNNQAERQIRPGVVLRKRGGCNRSERGAQTFERLASIAASRAQHGLSVMDWVKRLLCNPGPDPVPVLG